MPPGKSLAEYQTDIPAGQLLRWAREAKGVSIDELAPHLNLTVEEWRRYEDGVDPLEFRTIMHAAHLLQVTADYVWSGWVGSIWAPLQEVLLADHPKLQEIDRRKRAEAAGSGGSHTATHPGLSTGSPPRPADTQQETCSPQERCLGV
jgi:transcriptional regulator with XRE-family HTH domain